MTATLRAQVLGVSAEIRGDQARCDELAQLFPDLLALPSIGPARVVVDADPDPQVTLANFSSRTAEVSPLLCMHAGVVRGPAGCIAIPGHSGLGKTTLVAALVQAGFGYVSDETLAVDRRTGLASPFPRPLALNSDVWPLFGPVLGPRPAEGAEGLVQPATLGPVAVGTARVSDVLLARRPASPTPVSIERVPSRGQAVPALLGRAFNHYLDPDTSFRAVIDLVRQARVWTVEYSDARQLAAALAERFGALAAH